MKLTTNLDRESDWVCGIFSSDLRETGWVSRLWNILGLQVHGYVLL